MTAAAAMTTTALRAEIHGKRAWLAEHPTGAMATAIRRALRALERELAGEET